MEKKKVKIITVDADKCTGCRACEVICSAYHNDNIVNPKRSRIRVFSDEQHDVFVPITAGPYTDAECNGRSVVVIKGKKYGECSFCHASCPSRDLFKEPDAPDIPLKCDRCGDPPPEGGPMCVQWCRSGALTYVEEEREVNPSPKESQTLSLRYLVEKYGLAAIEQTLQEVAKSR
ncbi:MAG TPA: (4Fe-4S)-binding protein [Thermodesulfobacteriota bacterium]|nr:(4Fe-4S)-binding protein [Thermodesulfobacteriota bacterium]